MKPTLSRFKLNVLTVLFGIQSISRVITGSLGIILGISMLGYTGGTAELWALALLMPFTYWGTGFLIYGMLRVYDTLWKPFSYQINLVISGVGVWLYNYMLLSATIFLVGETTPVYYLFTIPVLLELIILVDIIYTKSEEQK